ncbi:MAG: peptidylprolyl isomerase [Candidatus Marinimicrobia bacterium]|nr:peptidylprolyl isomerase [Candidatus Neomarinimicrobiota bacterium]
MKKFAILLLVLLVAVTSCTKKEPSLILEKDSPAYNLAKSLTEKVPYYDPDQNNSLISTKYYDITTGDILNIIQTNFGNRAQQLMNFNADRIKTIIDQNALQMGEVKLLLRDAETLNIQVSDEEIDSLINKRYIRDGGQERFMSWLKNNNIKYETVRNDTRDGIMIEKYVDVALLKDFEVTEDELMESYQQDKFASVQHILLKTEGLDDSSKVAKYQEMESILKRAKAGEDFATLANAYSEDPGSSKNGGLYENFTRGRMVKPFEDASFGVPIGETSDIVETSYGYHIIKVIERKPEEKPFEEVKDSMKAKLEQEKRTQVYDANLERLKKKAKFKVIEY